jgi:hypothetical protein
MRKNDEGAEFLPMKLVTVLILAAIVLAFALSYTLAFIDRSSTAMARASAARIATLALTEYAEGCTGAGDGVQTAVKVPGSVRMIVFGSVRTNSLAEWAGTYTIQYRDGSNETYFAGAPLGAGGSAPARGGPLVLYPGQYSLRIGIEAVNGNMMALIYPEAA